VALVLLGVALELLVLSVLVVVFVGALPLFDAARDDGLAVSDAFPTVLSPTGDKEQVVSWWFEEVLAWRAALQYTFEVALEHLPAPSSTEEFPILDEKKSNY
jgi:hypothetical protein